MPSIGSCTDTTCDEEIKELYECHCCLRLVCLNHLNDHVEIIKSKQQFDSVRNELNTVVNTLTLIIEEKQLTIEREQNLIERTKKLLDVPSSSMDELQYSIEQINHTIASNRSDAAEESEIWNHDEYSASVNLDYVDIDSLNETAESTQDQHVNEVGEVGKLQSYRGIVGRCPLTFDGAYGLTEANHPIEFCSHKETRQIELYLHFIFKHRIKKVYAQQLVQAIADKQDPMETKLFDGNKDVIDHFYKVPCPFFSGQINSSKNSRQKVTIPSCELRLVALYRLRHHLVVTHKISKSLAQKLVNDFKNDRTKSNIALTQ